MSSPTGTATSTTLKALKPGKTKLRCSSKNGLRAPTSTMDAELTVLIPLPRPPKKATTPAVAAKNMPEVKTPVYTEEPRDPTAMSDRQENQDDHAQWGRPRFASCPSLTRISD